MIIFIDSSVLVQLCSTSVTDELAKLDRWFERSLIRAVVVSSTICDYEVRRGLLLAQERGINAGGLPQYQQATERLRKSCYPKLPVVTRMGVWYFIFTLDPNHLRLLPLVRSSLNSYDRKHPQLLGS